MRTMKKVLAAGLTAVMAMSLMVGCGNKKDDSSSKTYNLGIIQFAEHGSLDNCRKGFLKGLESEGIKEGENLKITYKNSQADTATDNQIASNFVSKKLDMICAIATPSAQSAYNATKDSDIPVVYTAVTSPKAAGFVDKEGKVEKWKLKTITADENDAIRKQCYKQVQVGKRMKQEFDTVKYLELLADKCVVYPDLHNVELQDFYNVMDSIKLLKKHLLNPGEYDDLMQEIQEINGYSLDDAVEEAKN